MAQTEVLADAIIEMHCSIADEMAIRSSKMHLGSILMNSAVRQNCGEIREHALLTVPQSDGSS